MTTAPLTETALLHGVAELARRDRDLADVVARLGPPPLWQRAPGFPTLVLLILEQQVRWRRPARRSSAWKLRSAP